MLKWLKLKSVKFKDSEIRKFMEMYKDFDELYLEKNFMLFNDKIKKKLEFARDVNLENFLYENNRRKIRIITPRDREYPKELKEIKNYPLFLYIKGNKIIQKNKNRKNIAVVGTRKMTKYGKSNIEKVVKELLDYKITLISGLAEGIDTVALTTALNKGGKTIAVVGTGLDIIYPYENKYLWEKISMEGTIISEYPLGTQGSKWSFPMRNRIIAGISDGILIGESYKRGGSLITAEMGFLLNKEIFAIPGFINYPSFEGCNNLIKYNKAKLVTCAEDIAREFLWDIHTEKSKLSNLDDKERVIFDCLYEEKSLEEIKIDIIRDIEDISINEILTILMNLKLKGIITETGNGKYVRIL